MRRVVVGVDGSEGSVRALEWAAQEARLRHLPLEIVLVWHPSPLVYGGTSWTAMSNTVFDDLRKDAEVRLDAACAAAGAALDDLEVERKVVEGSAAQVLVEAAAGAELLVVGSRGRGGFAELLLGSVSAQCAHHSPCPVLIVPRRASR